MYCYIVIYMGRKFKYCLLLFSIADLLYFCLCFEQVVSKSFASDNLQKN